MLKFGNSLKLSVRNIKRKLYLKIINIRLNFPIKKTDGKIKIVVSAKYKSIIKFIKYILAILGLSAAFFTFQSVFFAFLFSLVLFFVGLLLEKSLFSHYSMYITPLPNFEIEAEKWIGTSFGYAITENMDKIPLVEWVFSDEEYARRMHSLILAWACGEYRDKEKNVCLSVIINEDSDYTFYCYPNPDRKYAKHFRSEVESEIKKNKATRDDLHKELSVLFILGRNFDITEYSFLPEFKRKYKSGSPFLFRIMYNNDESQGCEEIEGLKNFIFYNLKIKKEKELTRKDVEYDFLRLV